MMESNQSAAMGGIVIISLPKSGTMFLSNYLQTITGYNRRFGLIDYMLHPDELKNALLPPDPSLTRILDEDEEFESRFVEVYRNRIYPSRKQESLNFGNWIISDHGFSDLSLFFRKPSLVTLIDPSAIELYAKKRGMKVLYLYREDIRDVANSLAHFITSKRTKFLNVRSFPEALDFCLRQHVPVLARQLRLWKEGFAGMKVSYESLSEHTRDTVLAICREFQLPCEPAKIIDQMSQFQAVSFRKGGSGDYRNFLSPEQIEFLTQKYPDLCPA